jgi:hypothetical protein
MLDPEAIEPEPRTGRRDLAQVGKVVGVAHVGDHNPGRIDAGCGERFERRQPSARFGVGVNHDRRARLHARRRDGGEDPRHVADEAVCLDRALEERRLDAGVVDPFAQLAYEQRRNRVDVAVGQEVRQGEERVDARRNDDVEVEGLVDPLDSGDVAAESGRRRIDDRLVPAARTSVRRAIASATRTSSSQ